ncbi:MAG: SpoIID/LytB domain-containing protein, partial [Acidimicrobiia bacterium]
MRTAVLLVVAGLAAGPLPAVAQEDPPVYLHETVELVPAEGTTLTWDGRAYAGLLRVGGFPDGLALVEQVSPEAYLLGIQEVPFSWDLDALRAQAVAARTYLAWTLSRGRSSAGERYGYDICATDACQVYGGLDQVRGSGGDRWAAAVRQTAGEVLVYGGAPAQALYSSTSGGRTRSSQDVFTSGTSLPYLQAVPSPGEDSPLVDWGFALTEEEMALLLEEAGVSSGELYDVRVDITEDGQGPWTVVVASDAGTRRIPTWEFRGMVNRAADVLGDRLPALRPDGRPYPQAVLSPTYTVTRTWTVVPPTDGSPFRLGLVYRFRGHGWGHLVGMSQYGAQAMAERGVSYGDILAHYYGGLRPQAASDLLPEVVEVGIAEGADEVRI